MATTCRSTEGYSVLQMATGTRESSFALTPSSSRSSRTSASSWDSPYSTAPPAMCHMPAIGSRVRRVSRTRPFASTMMATTAASARFFGSLSVIVSSVATLARETRDVNVLGRGPAFLYHMMAVRSEVERPAFHDRGDEMAFNGAKTTGFLAAIAVFIALAAPAFADDPTLPPPEPAWRTHRVTRAELSAAAAAQQSIYAHLFGERASTVARFNRLDPRFVHAGRRLRVPELPEGTEYVPLPQLFHRADADEKSILIVLDRQFLGVYERGRLVGSYPVSSGRDEHPTPTGAFRITRMDADHHSSMYPEPDGGWPMPWALRFHRSQYWIHGGELVGHPASRGCVRLFPEDAERLFSWAQIGVRVRIVRTL